MPISLIFDCGATNLRTVAVDSHGKLVAVHHIANNTQTGEESADSATDVGGTGVTGESAAAYPDADRPAPATDLPGTAAD